MRWTTYLEECLRILEEEGEYKTDQLLVYLVKVQVICNKVGVGTWNDTFGDVGTKVPHEFYVKALKTRLSDIERSLPTDLKDNGM
jgi:hypothetical protein